MKLHYICYYYADEERDEYLGHVAANVKVRYVANAAKEAGFEVTVFALNKTKLCRVKANSTERDGVIVRHVASRGRGNFFVKILNRLHWLWQVICYFFKEVKKDDVVILYHSMNTTPLFAFLKKFKKCKVILEVEEVYACSAKGVLPYYNKEIKKIKKYEDFIFVNGYIPEDLGIDKKKYITLYGSYVVADGEKRPNDGMVSVLYAGAIETLNEGAFKAVEVAEFLPENYTVHIIGSGEKQHVDDLTEKIDRMNAALKRKAVVYDGFRSGKDLDDYMVSCDIGLGTYQIKDRYSNYIFPSKLVSYMCRGLKVVTGRAECYESTPFSADWYFYDEFKSEAIAEAIVRAGSDRKETDSATMIRNLHNEFVKKLAIYRKTKNWENE